MPQVLRFMDVDPKLEDGRWWSSVRCSCLWRANLCADVKNGEVVFAGCPVCKKESVVEILPDGSLGFFPTGTVIIA
jgi:hypothetical protein